MPNETRINLVRVKEAALVHSKLHLLELPGLLALFLMLLHVVTEIAIDTVHEPLQLSRQQLIQLDVLQFALLAILVLFEHLLHLFLPLGLRF